jgi:catechol 2,3-dioxygenase-like lactoylglutathione lyase family enzyme
MTAVKIDRIMMYVKDLHRSVSFYTTLGLSVVTENEEVVRPERRARHDVGRPRDGERL